MTKKTVTKKELVKEDPTELYVWTSQEEVEKNYLNTVCDNMRNNMDLLKKYPEYLERFMNLVKEMDVLLSSTQKTKKPVTKTKKAKGK